MDEPPVIVIEPWEFPWWMFKQDAPPLTPDEMRWEDDGGPARPAQDGYEHVWSPVRAHGTVWWT